MDDLNYLSGKVERCRRLAHGLPEYDPMRSALLSLAQDYEAKAARLKGRLVRPYVWMDERELQVRPPPPLLHG